MEKLYIASKKFVVGELAISPGDLVDLSKLPEHKVGQLLRLRFIRPKPDSPNPTAMSST